ncbi:uncharacterized protein [Lolium perenne]|uniref:uncharacterized protein n=1 Tax=Lolium perenne TaxID=4522 RepID=UPI0021EAA921|nr:uncharacterized protein LOC127298881 [Lolium perenne]XP_051184789.1 uncharacterized protein LOC127298881 [Lolium perenne]
MGSRQDFAFGWEPWTAPALEDLLPQLSREEQLRVQDYLRQHQRVHKDFRISRHSEGERDFIIIRHVRYALHHYNAKHPGEEFDAVKPLMEASAFFRGQMWYHINFWARCRKTKKIKRFFAEVHYKAPFSSFVLPPPIPGAEKPLSSSNSVCSDLPPPVPGYEKPPSSSSSVCSDLPPPVPGAPSSSSSSVCSHLSHSVPAAPSCSSFFPVFIPIVEACTIIEEPLGRHWKSCAFCRGHLDILHPKGRKFVCGNDKDRAVQRIKPCRSPMGLKMPFTCHLGRDSNN